MEDRRDYGRREGAKSRVELSTLDDVQVHFRSFVNQRTGFTHSKN